MDPLLARVRVLLTATEPATGTGDAAVATAVTAYGRAEPGLDGSHFSTRQITVTRIESVR
jgi:hypothetical protein